MIYQAERPKSAREQREIDMGNARLVASIASARGAGWPGRCVPGARPWRPAPGRPAPCPETSR